MAPPSSWKRLNCARPYRDRSSANRCPDRTSWTTSPTQCAVTRPLPRSTPAWGWRGGPVASPTRAVTWSWREQGRDGEVGQCREHVLVVDVAQGEDSATATQRALRDHSGRDHGEDRA